MGIVILVSIILLTACTGNQEQIHEMEGLLDEAEGEIAGMSEQITQLEGTIEEKDQEIEALLTRLEQIEGDQKDAFEFYEKDKTKYHGYAEIKGPYALKALPSESSYSFFEHRGGLAKIITEVHTSNNEHWLLVKTFGRTRTYGYVRSNEVEIVERGASKIQESDITMSGLRLGASVYDAIKLLGSDYVQYNVPGHYFLEGLIYSRSKSEDIEILYQPVSKKIEEIRTQCSDLKVEGLFGVGDDIEKVEAYFEEAYETETEESSYGVYSFTVWLPNENRIVFYFKEDHVIYSIHFTIHPFYA